MKTEKLFDLLTLMGTIESNCWKTVMDVVECINGDESVKIVKKEWEKDWKNKSEYCPLNLNDIKIWRTYDKCINIYFCIKNKKLNCKAAIYDGNILDSSKTNLRFVVELILPDSFIHILEDTINSYFKIFLEDEYEKYLESKKKKWINKLKNEILNS